jgi:3',5'-cyclic AMP phosphodiesterase CpdA
VNAGGPYFAYFGASAPRPYYSFDVGAWHVLSLNSNISVTQGSPQYEWVRSDLASNPALCTLAYWHHPRFSSGPNGNHPRMSALWQLLDEAGVEVVLAGHDHLYERFAPQDADGRPASAGIRAFVVGTGGTHLYEGGAVQPNSEVRGRAWGVLKLTLRSTDYAWEFVPVPGYAFRDFGTASCS